MLLVHNSCPVTISGISEFGEVEEALRGVLGVQRLHQVEEGVGGARHPSRVRTGQEGSAKPKHLVQLRNWRQAHIYIMCIYTGYVYRDCGSKGDACHISRQVP